MEVKVLLSFVLCINLCRVSQGQITDVPRDVCSSISRMSVYFQGCLGVLGVFKRTISTQDEVCQIYNEVISCLQKKAVRDGQTCNLQNAHATFTEYVTYGNNWMQKLRTDICTVKELPESICTVPDRLGLVSMSGCGVSILGSFSTGTYSKGFICATISNLDACTQNFMRMLGDNHCTRDDIKNGLMSTSVTLWLKTNYPSISLDACFHVYSPGKTGGDSECSDFAHVAKNAQQALGLMHRNNVTEVGQDLYCKLFYFAVHLVQHEIEETGHVCSISVMRDTLEKLLGYQGISSSVLGKCQDINTISPAEFCGDDSSVLQVLAHEPYCTPYIRRLLNNNKHGCGYIRQFVTCSETKLRYAGFECSKGVFDDSKLREYLKLSHNYTLPVCQ